MSDKELVKICLIELCKKLGYEDSQLLIQRDLEHLCFAIKEKTRIQISLSTIKRLLNGQFIRLPQIATLNAITVYLGYENWQDFKIKKKNENPGIPASESKLTGNQSIKKNKARIPYKIIGLGITALFILVIISFNDLSSSGSNNYEEVLFTARKTTHHAIPNTVVFNYDIDKVVGDSFFIQQSWDKNRRVRIYKNQHTLTDIYYEPGYHTAKLIVNDQIIKTFGVNIPTDRWFFYSKESIAKGLPTYIQKDNAMKNGVLCLEKDDLVNNHIDIQKDQRYYYTFFPSKFEVESDNFRFTTKIRMTDLKNSICPMLIGEVFCEKNFIYFSATPSGCTSNINAQFGENFLSGKTNDLSGFGCDVRQWQRVEMVVKNQQVKVYLNQKEVFSNGYSKSSGLITGLGFISNGLCEIDFVELKGLNDQVVYQNGFDN